MMIQVGLKSGSTCWVDLLPKLTVPICKSRVDLIRLQGSVHELPESILGGGSGQDIQRE